MHLRFVALFLLLLPSLAFCRDVQLTWSQQEETPDFSWNVYQRQGSCATSGEFLLVAEGVPTKTYLHVGVPYGRISYIVTARIPDIDNPGQFLESDPSNCADAVVKPHPPVLDPPVVQ